MGAAEPVHESQMVTGNSEADALHIGSQDYRGTFPCNDHWSIHQQSVANFDEPKNKSMVDNDRFLKEC